MGSEVATFDCFKCETRWAFGEAGICDLTLNQCNCSSDLYSGVDDWTSFSTCHVYIPTKQAIHKILLFFAAIALIVSTVALILSIKALLSYKPISNMSTRQSNRTTHRVNSAGTTLTNRIDFSLRRDKVYYKLKELLCMPRDGWGLVDMFLYSFFSLTFIFCCFLYELNMVLSINPFAETYFNGKMSNKIILAVMFFSCQYAGYFLILSWLHNLPDAGRYGNLLGISAILVRFPRLIHRIVNISFLFGGFWPFALLVLIPAISHSENAEAILKVSYALLQVNAVVMLLGYLLLGLNLHRLFRKLKKSLESSQRISISPQHFENKIQDIEKALNTIKASLMAFTVFVVSGTIVMFVFAAHGFLYQYLFFATLFGAVYFFSVPFQLFILRKNSKKRKPQINKATRRAMKARQISDISYRPSSAHSSNEYPASLELMAPIPINIDSLHDV